MSLKRKIIVSFVVTAGIIAILAGFLSLNFFEIRKETSFLELTDTIRSKTLQLRRHEKNYFLYAPEKAGDESRAIHDYLDQISVILSASPVLSNRTSSLEILISDYRMQFTRIEALLASVHDESVKLAAASKEYRRVASLIEANFLDKPTEDIAFLMNHFSFSGDHEFVRLLQSLDAEIAALRKTGEGILGASKELDKQARDRVEGFVHLSQAAIVVIFPLFLIVGFGSFIVITSSIVHRLQVLSSVIEKTGTGDFDHVNEAGSNDEVDQLIRKFNFMEDALSSREKELLRSKKLAAIGTLASGVAHELNNPLNNIYTTAQRLMKRHEGDISEQIRRGLDDILGQSIRVKRIVGDLLEFARGRDPNPRPVELGGLVRAVFANIGNTVDTRGIGFSAELIPDEIVIYADPEQLEQVFINLFTNAVEAMPGKGTLAVRCTEREQDVVIETADNGNGMPRESIDKIFEPFFTTKDKGTGLGLAIVYGIVQKHHGRISVTSEEGKGTTFTVTLPKRHGI
ncbi:MAG: hypothetical protein OHK006_01450 [Thermodesulfovibrionales bacterium]